MFFSTNYREIVVEHDSWSTSLPLILDRPLDKLQGKDDSFLGEDDLFKRTAARALYEGFNEAAIARGDSGGAVRLVNATLFFHPSGQILTMESWKSYVTEHSHRYSVIKLYKNLPQFLRDNTDIQVGISDRREILSTIIHQLRHITYIT